MIIAFWLSMAVAGCHEVSVQELASVGAPAVIVLGERHGVRSDLRIARRLVDALAASGPVTLALEAAHEDHQAALDRFVAGEVGVRGLRRGLRWEQTWGFSWGPYRRLFRRGRRGVHLVAAGLTLGPAPDDRLVSVPEGYEDHLATVMQAHGATLDGAAKARFARSMAWRDLRIGELAVDAWNGRGTLVILTGRGHVEGGWGTPRQLRELTAAPIESVLLSSDSDSACAEGDRVLVP